MGVIIGDSGGGIEEETDPLALKVADNLSDLDDVPTARSNLGLGSAAVEDAGTNIGDVVQLEDVDGSPGLPAVDASQLLHVPTSNDSIRTRSTGVYLGGIVTANGVDDSTFDMSAGGASLLDAWTDPVAPISRVVTWGAQTGLTITNTGARTSSYLGIRFDDVAPAGGDTQPIAVTIDGEPGIVYLTFSATRYTSIERRDTAAIAFIFHPAGAGGTILTVEETVNTNIGPIHSLLDLFDVIGNVQTEGGAISANGANLSLDISAGVQFRPGAGWGDTAIARKRCNFADTPGTTQAPIIYSYQDGGGGWSSTASALVIDPIQWDDGSGALQAVGPSKWTIQEVFLFSSGAIRLTFGQSVYNSLDDARASLTSESPLINPGITASGVLVCRLVVRGAATDLTDAGDAFFGPVSKFQSVAGGGGEINTIEVEPGATGIDPTGTKVLSALRTLGMLGREGITTVISGDDVAFDLDVNGLTEDLTPDAAADYLLSYDASAGEHKKVKLENLPAPGAINTGSYWFDGANSASIANASSPNLFLGATDFTIEAWIHVGSVSGDDVYCSRWEEADNASKNFIFRHDGSGRLELLFYDTSVGLQLLQSPIERFEDSGWTHVAVTWDATLEEAAFYINGRVSGTDSITLTGTIQDGTADFVVGAEQDGTDFFVGHINCLRIWGDKRTQLEIGQRMYDIIGVAGDSLISEWSFNGDADDPISSYDLTNNGAQETAFVPWRV